MRIQIASDLHLEFFQGRFGDDITLPFAEGSEVLVLAGDIHKRDRAITLFKSWPVPVIYVHGNHEHYKEHIWKNTEKLRSAAAANKIHYLENDAWVYRGVRFLGCALWTDYELFGNSAEAMSSAEASLNDHKLISTHYKRFSPTDALAIHKDSRRWLETQLNEPFDGKTVIVTHHAPHSGSIAPEFAKDSLSPSFVSNLTDLMGKASLWIHGHVHSSFDYVVDGTRVVANPRGYPLNPRTARSLSEVRYENERFISSLVIEI